MSITVTESAAAEFDRMLASDARGECAIHLEVRGGGCAGFMYHLSVAPHAPGAVVLECGRTRLECDAKSSLFVRNLTIDHSGDAGAGGFRFFNPEHLRVCGCGRSFAL